jgi:hypothetical protein
VETPAEGKPRSKASTTGDLAASAPAGDAAAAQTPSSGKAQPPGQAPPAGQMTSPDQLAKSDQPDKSAKPIDWDKAADKTGDKAILGIMDSPVTGLAIGAYGEILFGAAQNPAAGGQWQGGADIRRMVLLPTYAITDNIIFNAELEWEHGGSLRPGWPRRAASTAPSPTAWAIRSWCRAASRISAAISARAPTPIPCLRFRSDIPPASTA